MRGNERKMCFSFGANSSRTPNTNKEEREGLGVRRPNMTDSLTDSHMTAHHFTSRVVTRSQPFFYFLFHHPSTDFVLLTS